MGNTMIANRKGTALTYVHQDHLTGTSVTSDTSGASVGTIKFYPFGSTRSSSGTLPAQKFTGQRLDDTGLYYYNARYYDATIGRFISPDTVGTNIYNPQSLNRYSYVLNNPLRYADPSGTTAQNLSPPQKTKVITDSWVVFIPIGTTASTTTDTVTVPASGSTATVDVTTTTTVSIGFGGGPSITTQTATTITVNGASATTTYTTGSGENGLQYVYGAINKMVADSIIKDAINASQNGSSIYTKAGIAAGTTMAGSLPLKGPDDTAIFVAPAGSRAADTLDSWKKGGITLGHAIIFNQTMGARDVTHELVHVNQYDDYGLSFLLEYGSWALLTWSYTNIPLEVAARRAAGQ